MRNSAGRTHNGETQTHGEEIHGEASHSLAGFPPDRTLKPPHPQPPTPHLLSPRSQLSAPSSPEGNSKGFSTGVSRQSRYGEEEEDEGQQSRYGEEEEEDDEGQQSRYGEEEEEDDEGQQSRYGEEEEEDDDEGQQSRLRLQHRHYRKRSGEVLIMSSYSTLQGLSVLY
ncbi:unnamed protein product [Gadus morhua 'NCC']